MDLLCSAMGVADLDALAHAAMEAGDGTGTDKRAMQIIAAKVSELEGDAKKEERRRNIERKERLVKRLAAEEAKAKADEAAAVWSDQELLLLGQAIKRFPGGTLNRWEKVSDYVNHGSKGSNRTQKECVNQTQTLGSSIGAKMGERFQAAASENFGQAAKKEKASAAALLGAATALGKAPPDKSSSAVAVAKQGGKLWSDAEQRAFEIALKAIPSSEKDARWTKVAGASAIIDRCLPEHKEPHTSIHRLARFISVVNRPQRTLFATAHMQQAGFRGRAPLECKKRFKYLAKMVKEKKAAAAAAAAAAAGVEEKKI